MLGYSKLAEELRGSLKQARGTPGRKKSRKARGVCFGGGGLNGRRSAPDNIIKATPSAVEKKKLPILTSETPVGNSRKHKPLEGGQGSGQLLDP